MGSLPQLSVIKGPNRQLKPNLIDKLIDETEDLSKTALIYEANGAVRTHSYEELINLSNKLSAAIRNIVVGGNLQRNSDGDYLIAVNLPPTDYLVVVLLAIWKCGAAYLPLDKAFPDDRIEHILKESKPVLVIHDEATNEDLRYFGTKTVSLDQLLENAQSANNLPILSNERLQHLNDDLACVLYTSGSTGIPKGVRLPHKVILNRLNWQFNTFPYSQTEQVCVFKTALTFVDCISEIWGPLINNKSLLVVPKHVTQNPEQLINVLEMYQIERLVLVPTLLRSILMYANLDKSKRILPNLRIFVCSGETLVNSLVQDFYSYFPETKYKLCNFYGSTEVMGDVTFHIVNPKSNMDKVPIGLPLDNTVIYLLDSDLRPVQHGEIGELYAAGLNLSSGYVNGRDPDKFIDNPLAIDPNYAKLYKTGDFARFVKNCIVYEGRTDSQIKIRGHRVDLSEIEKAVKATKNVDKCIVLCYKPGEISQTILSFVTCNSNINARKIEDELKTKLTSYMVPQVIVLKDIPLLVNGKIDRQSLLRNYEDSNNNLVDFQTLIEFTGVSKEVQKDAKILFETVASVLSRSARGCINLQANFYEIGGNSLNSIFTISKLNELGYSINIGDFLSAKNLGEILQKMTSTAQTIDTKSVYSADYLNDGYKSIVKDMVTTSFYQKAELEQFILSEITEQVYDEVIDKLWPALLQQNLSFVVRNPANGKIMGCALNFDARNEPEVEIESKLTVIFEFLDTIEGPVKDKLPLGLNQILHCFMMATHSSLTAQENVQVMDFMENRCLEIAKLRKFSGILTTNTSPLTQQLGTDVYKYKTMDNYQINKYVASDGSKPFEKAPDNMRAIVQWKLV